MSWPAMRNADLETFLGFDAPTRDLILRQLGRDGGPTEADNDELQRHPQCQALSSWLLELPAYQWSDDDEDDELESDSV